MLCSCSVGNWDQERQLRPVFLTHCVPLTELHGEYWYCYSIVNTDTVSCVRETTISCFQKQSWLLRLKGNGCIQSKGRAALRGPIAILIRCSFEKVAGTLPWRELTPECGESSRSPCARAHLGQNKLSWVCALRKERPIWKHELLFHTKILLKTKWSWLLRTRSWLWASILAHLHSWKSSSAV